mgnify:FL=1|jgi:hypothetical protein
MVWICGLLILGPGCATIRDIKKRQSSRREQREVRKNNYLNLQRAIATNTIRTGMAAQELKKEFGEPDDIFYSSSNISSFQIWTYQKVVENPGDKDWNPIRLYFESDKLISWKY